MIANGVMAEKVKALGAENDRLARALIGIKELIDQELDIRNRQWAESPESNTAAARMQEAMFIRLMVLAEMENVSNE